MSSSLGTHRLYSPWNSPGQNTGLVALSFSRGSSQPGDWMQVSHIAGGFFTSWATREAQEYLSVASSFSRRSSQPRNQTRVSLINGRFFFNWAIREACLVTKLCPTLCDPMDCSLPGSSVHGVSQERILKWVALSFSRGSSWFRDWTCLSCIGKWTAELTGKPFSPVNLFKKSKFAFIIIKEITDFYNLMAEVIASHFVVCCWEYRSSHQENEGVEREGCDHWDHLEVHFKTPLPPNIPLNILATHVCLWVSLEHPRTW